MVTRHDKWNLKTRAEYVKLKRADAGFQTKFDGEHFIMDTKDNKEFKLAVRDVAARAHGLQNPYGKALIFYLDEINLTRSSSRSRAVFRMD